MLGGDKKKGWGGTSPNLGRPPGAILPSSKVSRPSHSFTNCYVQLGGSASNPSWMGFQGLDYSTVLAAPLSPIHGDLLTFGSFSFQTREQLQADLLRCQAKIEDLEKLLVEKGQVSRNDHGVLRMSVPSWCRCGLGAKLSPPHHRSELFAPETLEKKSTQAKPKQE